MYTARRSQPPGYHHSPRGVRKRRAPVRPVGRTEEDGGAPDAQRVLSSSNALRSTKSSHNSQHYLPENTQRLNEGEPAEAAIKLVDDLPPSFRDNRSTGPAKLPDGTGTGGSLRLGILSELQATLNGTRNSTTMDRTKSDACGSPTMFDGTMNTTLSSTLKGGTANLNETLGRSERAELMTADMLETDTEGPLEMMPSRSVENAMHHLRAALQGAEDDPSEGVRPVAVLGPPRTQAAIARLVPRGAAQLLDTSVGMQSLSVQSVRRRFGPLRRNYDEPEAGNSDGDTDSLNALLSVCSEARSLFKRRAPTSDCGSRMAVSRIGSGCSSCGSLQCTSGRCKKTTHVKTTQTSRTRTAPRVNAKGNDVKAPAQQVTNFSLCFADARRLRRRESALLRNAMHETAVKLQAHFQEQPEQARLLCMVRQWIDRTLLMVGKDGHVEEDPEALHQHAIEKSLKEEEATRSRVFLARLQAKEKLRMESVVARDHSVHSGSAQRFSRQLDILAPHKALCARLNPFDTPTGASEYEFVSVVRNENGSDDLFSASCSSRSSAGTPSIIEESFLPSNPSGTFRPFSVSPENLFSRTESGLLELLLLALVDSSKWGNPGRPGVPNLPTLLFTDAKGAATQLSNLYLQSSPRAPDLCILLDVHRGLHMCSLQDSSLGVRLPPQRSSNATTTLGPLLPLPLPSHSELGLRGMPPLTVEVLPLTLTYAATHAGSNLKESFCVAVDLLELFRQLPSVAAETVIRYRGGGTQNPHYRVNLPHWCKAAWKRALLEVAEAAKKALSHLISTSDIVACELQHFEIDWMYAIELSRWRCHSLKHLADVMLTQKVTTATTCHMRPFAPPKIEQHDGVPYAIGPRVYYVFDMHNLYITAALAADQTNTVLVPRLQLLSAQYRTVVDDLRAVGVRDKSRRNSTEVTGPSDRRGSGELKLTMIPSDSTWSRSSGRSPKRPKVGLATALRQWSALQKVLDVEMSYALCLNTVCSNELSIVTFNAHVDDYNAYQSCQSTLWGPMYCSGLRLAYALCLYLEGRPFHTIPEKLVAFFHPISQFSGCSGGYREMKANLKDIKISIAERCRRVAVAVETMSLDDAEKLLEAATDTLNYCSNVSDIVSCQATEADVLTTTLSSVGLPAQLFKDLRPLTEASL